MKIQGPSVARIFSGGKGRARAVDGGLLPPGVDVVDWDPASGKLRLKPGPVRRKIEPISVGAG